jgi:protein CLEC16A
MLKLLLVCLCVQVYLHKILQQPANRSGEVAKQVLQTLGIIIQNVRSETGIYFLFSNNHINNIVGVPFDFEDEEVLGFYISFLKAISLKLTPQTVQFFIVDEDAPLPAQPGSSDGQELAELEREGANQQQGDQLEQEDTALHYGLPLYSEAIKFAHHHEGMVRAGVRTLTLNVLSVQDAHIQAFVTRQPAAAYFTSVANYLVQQVQVGCDLRGCHLLGLLATSTCANSAALTCMVLADP